MKHILRKLHIGGGHDNFDGRVSRLNSTEAVTPQDSTVAPTSSGFSGWLSNARHSLLPSSNGATPRARHESTERTSVLGLESSQSEGRAPHSFNYYEEEYQIQLALALSMSSENAVDDPESLQIRAAKRISLGRPPSPGNTPAESAAYRYWAYNVLDYEEKVIDGFYDVYGVVSDFGNAEKIPSLIDLQGTPLTDMLGYEAILVDRTIDPDLVHLEQAALCLAVDCGMSGVGPQSSVLVQKIADLVVQQLGGPVVDANDALKRWRSNSYELRTSFNNIVLPLGSLKFGLSRHRALLFKVLADHVGIPCRIVKGSHYTGTDEGAVNIVKLELDREYIVDLMGAPGTLLPPEIAGATGHVDLFENTALVEELFSQIEKAQNKMLKCTDASTSAALGDKKHSQFSNSSIEVRDLEEGKPSPSNERFLRNDLKCHYGERQKSPYVLTQESLANACGKEDAVVDMPNSDVHNGTTVQVSDPHKLLKLDSLESSEGGVKSTKVHYNEVDINFAREHIQHINSDLTDLNKAGSSKNRSSASCYIDCWTKHVNNKGGPMLENVAECEIPWEEIVIGERIGLGSYGEVYLGDWHGIEVAVKKFLDQDFLGDALDEFISEVQIMRRMQHPNVVHFLGAVTRPPNLSIVTEYLPRGSLFRLLHRPNCQLDERLRLKMALDVAEGMNYLHTSRPIIVHRDLKSPNLLVDKDWVVKVCDFGLSRLKHHTFLSSKSTAGTPEWMAPEVLRNEPSNEKCDVYSFGVILWELVTLQQPWSGMNPMQVVGAVGFQDRRLELPKNLEPSIAQIITGCWQSDPKLRPSFSDITVALRPLDRLLND
ncbi:hypothetical protein KP509_32G045200 [Ceratopteris richardii]|uniref:non-specific serine/threonine protein kinase n=1 Tax=Ceratopteris richardii TaxID=49495 RepID=A0A8T2QV82_CERRI|nr:hypothetical protein KP509_32G045200 [Ceratopteris richardii]